MSEESKSEFEDYVPERKGSLFGDLAMVSVALGLNFVLLAPFLVPQRTMGASTTDYLDRRGKPLLLELRNCRVVSPENGNRPGAPGAVLRVAPGAVLRVAPGAVLRVAPGAVLRVATAGPSGEIDQ